MRLTIIKTGRRLAFVAVFLATGCFAQSIPSVLCGKWVVQRELPTGTISCWGEPEARKLIGTEIEYSQHLFRWNNLVTNDPIANTKIITANKFHDENSSPSSSGSNVTFEQLGIKATLAKEITIQHEDAHISGATFEIPGDSVLVKNAHTIVFSVCNIYFEAKRVRATK